MRVIELSVENVKKLKAIQIKPTSDVVEISGKNGAGKSSTLDAIWWALAGRDNIQSQPIRKGEAEARVYLDLGELKITRKFKRVGEDEFTTSISVETAEGARFGTPQKMLDALVGELSFDPLGFARMPAKAKFDALKGLVAGADFDEIERLNKIDFDERRDVNRSAREARSAALSIEIPADAPTELIDVSELSSHMEEAGAFNADIERRKARREAAATTIEQRNTQAAQFVRRIADASAALEALRLEHADWVKGTEELRAKLEAADPLPEPIDTTDIKQRIAGAELTNNLVRQRAERDGYAKRADTLEAKAAALTKAMEERSAAKAKAIADAKLPVEGLTLDDGQVFLNGIPFEQASDAEQLRASMAIAMAMSPKLRVLRVRDGSLLDSASMDIVAEMAGGNDFQVWIERVESGRPNTIVIEDGAIRE